MATVTVPTRPDLKREDDRAWKAYELICWDVNATPEQRAEVFQAALVTMTRLMAFDKAMRG